MLKRLLTVTALCLTPLAVKAVGCPEFSQSQLTVLKKAHDYGAEHMGGHWGLVMAAISYQESSAGENLINSKGSYGVFQNRLTTVVKRTGHSPVEANRNLIRDFEYSAQRAKEELDFWNQSYYRKTGDEANLSHVLASYNAGYDKASGMSYAQKVIDKMLIIDECVITD